MNFCVVTEGKTRLYVPHTDFKGPGKKSSVFYNPAMEFSRDITVIVMNSLKPKNALDGLSGTGARGVRIANETDIQHVVLNEVNRDAYKVILKNIELNSLKNAVAVCKNLNVLLSENNDYQYIDIDPYGSPVYFVDSAFRSVKKECFFGITATDTATLCGVYQKACIKKYFSVPLHCGFMNEIGIRILLYYLSREGMKYNFYIQPLLVYSTNYYFRVYIYAKKNASIANKMLEKIGYVVYNTHTDEREICEEKIHKPNWSTSGPIWIAELYDIEFLDKLNKIDFSGFNTAKKLKKMIDLWREEAIADALYYNIHHISRILKCSPPQINKLICRLKECGFFASKTHFSHLGIKTSAKIDEIKALFQ